jgi:hypothetical protein
MRGDLFWDNTEFARIIALVTTQMLLARRMKDHTIFRQTELTLLQL